jgi:hypothetical protein
MRLRLHGRHGRPGRLVIPGAMQREAVHCRPGISLSDHDMQNPGDAGGFV